VTEIQTGTVAAVALAPTAADPNWRMRALCAEVDPELFFPEPGGPVQAAVAVCRRCPVQERCLEWALDSNERFGIWGGATEQQRVLMRRDARRQCEAEGSEVAS
jgi:WhiB family redox-sensing transcriptional regulator